MFRYGSIQFKSKRTSMGHSLVFEVCLWLLFALALLGKCIYFQYSTNLSSGNFFSAINTNMFLMTISSILIVTAIIMLPFNKKRVAVLLGIDIFFTLLLFADILYYRYYFNAITIPVLYQIRLVTSVTDSANNLFSLSDLIFFADIPFIIAGLIYVKKTVHENVKTFNIKFRAISAIVIFLCGFVLFSIIYPRTSRGTFTYDNNYVINNTGILYFHYYDAKKFVQQNLLTDRKLTDSEKKEIEDFYSSKKAGTTGNYTGIAKGKNLIVVQVESLQQFVINTKYNGQEITPNLNKFIKESAYFDNYYYMTGAGNTSDAEFLSNNSLYPLKDGSVYFRYPSNTYESTAKLLKAKGYQTYVFHANNPSFWNRTEMYRAEGFDKFISNNDFKHDEQIGWGLSDKSMFRQGLDKIDTSKPFYSFFITLTSHHPFNYFDNYNGFDPGTYSGTLVGNYLKAAHYADEALGGFIEELKSRGLYDNSVVVIYGDHNAVQKEDSQLAALSGILNFNYNEFNWTKLQKVPLFIHFPGMTQFGTAKKIGGQIDLLPTIANLMGFDAPHALGKDLFNSSKSYAVVRSGSVITDDFVYVNSNDTVYSSSGAILKKKDYAKKIEEYQKTLNISDLILSKNVLKELEKDQNKK